MDDLIDCCVPGDTLRVCGVVKSIEVAETGASRGASSNKPKCMYVLFIQAISVVNSKASSAARAGSPSAGISGGASAAGLSLSLKDLEGIHRIATKPRLFELLVASVRHPGVRSPGTRSRRALGAISA